MTTHPSPERPGASQHRLLEGSCLLPRVLRDPRGVLQSRGRARELGEESPPPWALPWGGNSSSLWEARHAAVLLVACLSEPHVDEVRAYVTTMTAH